MSYEEEKQDRKIEQLGAEIERLRGFETAARDLNNDLIRIAGERDELAARIQELEALRSDILEAMRRPKTTSSDGLILYLKELDEYNIRTTKRVGELEDALVEERANCVMAYEWQEDLPNLEDCADEGRYMAEARQQLQTEGKIGPDADECPDDLPPIGSPYRSWQITDERKAAIQHILVCHHCRYGDSGCKAPDVLRAMLEAGQ